MSAYSQLDEEKVRDQALVEDWIHSGLLNADQDQPLQASLRVTLRQTNSILRAVLAFFAALLVIASVGLTLTLLEAGGGSASRMVFGVWAAICLGGAWLLATVGRLYRCGVEEALAASSVVLLALTITENQPWEYGSAVRTLVCALASLGIYLLFRFRYALAASALIAGFSPFSLRFEAVDVRSLSLLVFALVLVIIRMVRQHGVSETADEDWRVAGTAAFAGFYLVLNLMITPRGVGPGEITSGWFYWFTYAMTWIVPSAGLWFGVRGRDRLAMDVSGIALLVTILTNKAYLGWERHTWDPIILGVLLIFLAVGLRRWLSPARSGFTPLRLLESENRAISAASALSLALPQTPSAGAAEQSSMRTGGGKSGGGGASGEF
jgi:hypothetical protein